MADEELAIAQPEAEAPPIEVEHVEEVPQTVGDEPAAEGDAEEQQTEQAPEFVTVERNGKTFQVPKELEGEFLMQADYTRKRQADAEKAKSLDSRESEINQLHQATEQELDARANLRAVDAELDRFKAFDWPAYQAARQMDPMGADESWNYAQHLRNQKAELEQHLGRASQERAGRAQQEFAKRVQQTLEAAPKIIPGWKAETANDTLNKLVAFATSEGISEQGLKANWGPELLSLLHKAQIGHQTMQRATAPKPAQAMPVEPLQVVSAKAAPTVRKTLTDLAKSDDVSEFATAFNQRMKGRGR